MTKILFATYTIKVRLKHKKEYFKLDNIETKDLFDLFLKFIRAIESNPTTISQSIYNSNKIKTKKTLRLGRDLNLNITDRVYYGRFESGISGSKGVISDIEKNDDIFKMQENHARMHPLFFYIDIPKNKKEAYLILQRENSFGIKGLFLDSFNLFLANLGYKDYFIEINNLLLPKVLTSMLDKGKVKNVTLFENTLPPEIEDVLDSGWNKKLLKLEAKTVIKNKIGIPIKGLIRKVFYSKLNGNFTEVDGLQKRFKEVSFTLEQDNKIKTYYLMSQNKTLPDLDVTDDIKWDTKYLVPTIESLNKIAKLEIGEMKNALEKNKNVSKN